MKRHFVIVDGIKVMYARGGKGKPVVLVHGLMGSSVDFPELVPFLSKHFDLIALDLPGCGDSEKLLMKHTPESYGDFLKNFLKKLSLSDVSAIGNCSGGAVVLSCAIQAPELFRKMVLLSPIYHKKVFNARAKIVYRFFSTKIAKKLLRFVINHDFTMDLVLGLYMRHARRSKYGYATKIKKRQADLDANIEFGKSLFKIDLREKLKNMKIPTLVVYYKNDSMIKNETIRMICMFLPDCRVFSSGLEGHFADPDMKVKERDEIVRFLRE